MAFRGFPDEAITFYEGLVADNSRTWWLANKPVYDRAVRGPLLELLDELDVYGPFHVFRPNRDVRFSKDKRPYKENIGAYGESQGGTGHYIGFSLTGMVAGSGYYSMAADQLERFREAIDGDVLGGELVELAASVEAKGLRLGAMESLKTAPRGYSKDHPRIELLRRKGLMSTREWAPAAWMRTKAVVGRVRDTWEAGAELNSWLDAHVGPSTMPPEERNF